MTWGEVKDQKGRLLRGRENGEKCEWLGRRRRRSKHEGDGPVLLVLERVIGKTRADEADEEEKNRNFVWDLCGICVGYYS